MLSDAVKINTPNCESSELTYYGTPPAEGVLWPAGSFYTDASGGPDSAYPLLRRTAVGIVVLKQDRSLYAAEDWFYVLL